MFKTHKTIEEAFPNLSTTITHMCNGIEKYAPKKYYMYNPEMPTGEHNSVRFVSGGICAIMAAMGEIPRGGEINTPNERYGWDFDETRDIIGAIDSLAQGNIYYWREYLSMHRNPVILDPPLGLHHLTWASWPKNIKKYRNYTTHLKNAGL